MYTLINNITFEVIISFECIKIHFSEYNIYFELNEIDYNKIKDDFPLIWKHELQIYSAKISDDDIYKSNKKNRIFLLPFSLIKYDDNDIRYNTITHSNNTQNELNIIDNIKKNNFIKTTDIYENDNPINIEKSIINECIIIDKNKENLKKILRKYKIHNIKCIINNIIL